MQTNYQRSIVFESGPYDRASVRCKQDERSVHPKLASITALP